MRKKFINPPDLPNWEQSFSQIVIVQSTTPTRTIYLSGQVSVDRRNNLVGEGDLKTQAEYALANLQRAVAAARATVEDVVKMNIYVKDYKPTDATIVGQAMRRVFQQERLPASTWLGVQGLALEGLLIEIDAIAVVEETGMGESE